MPIYRANDKLVYFAHIPKCGGSSIEQYLERRFGAAAFLDRRYLGQSKPWTNTSPQHVDKFALERLFPESFFDLSFAVVRNPVSRLISEYHWQRDHYNAIPLDKSFTEWLSDIEALVKGDSFELDNHLRHQVDFIPGKSTVFRLEEGLKQVEKFINGIFGDVEIDIDMFREHERTEEKVQATPEDVRIIEALFRKDYEKLRYSLRYS